MGRAGDAATAQATLGRFRVVTLSGVGGVGKTRLALRVAADARSRYRDGAWICELAAVADAAAVPDLLATTLGVQQRLGHTVTDRLVEYLRGRSMLLLLDNCEHVLGAVAGLVDNLVRDCPGLTVLATSREPLGVDGEQILPLQPLPVPPPLTPGGALAAAVVPSVALFCQRATAAAMSSGGARRLMAQAKPSPISSLASDNHQDTSRRAASPPGRRGAQPGRGGSSA